MGIITPDDKMPESTVGLCGYLTPLRQHFLGENLLEAVRADEAGEVAVQASQSIEETGASTPLTGGFIGWLHL